MDNRSPPPLKTRPKVKIGKLGTDVSSVAAVPRMPFMGGVTAKNSNSLRITESPEPSACKARSGPIHKVIDITFSSESEDDSEIEIIETRVLPSTVSRKRKIVGSCGGPRQDKKSRLAPPVAGRSHTFTIKGQTLRTTEVFDTFWYFAAERKAIDDRRRSGKSFPWTQDPILRKYPFCNTFRVLDKVCQYLICEVIEKGSQEPEEVVFRVLLFNTFTKIETWELLEGELAPLSWATYDRRRYQKVLGKEKVRGKTLYTGSFIKPAPSFGYSDNYMNHLCLLELFMEQGLPARLTSAEYLADVYEFIASFPSMGDFTTYQLMLNLSYSGILNFHPNDFVIPGPGAISGLRKMFGKGINKAKGSVRGFEVEVIRWLAETQHQHFKRLGIGFPRLGPAKLPMDVADIEHILCEVDKYSRLAHPQFKGKRTEMRRLYEPSKVPYPKEPYLPRAWSHPDRKVPRVKRGLSVVQKRYIINKIGGCREGKGGAEYLVYWFGYSDQDATWEPEELLLEDAPLALTDYLEKKRRKKSV